MILTVDLPEALHKKIEAEKKKTGLSKSMLVRFALLNAFLPGVDKKGK